MHSSDPQRLFMPTCSWRGDTAPEKVGRTFVNLGLCLLKVGARLDPTNSRSSTHAFKLTPRTRSSRGLLDRVRVTDARQPG